MRATRASFKDKIGGFVERNPAHATEVLHALLDIASNSRKTADPTNNSLAVSSTLFYISPGSILTPIPCIRPHILQAQLL